jgi:dienelactone hydrolase
MYEYFPGNYWWSVAVLNSLGMGGEISEIDSICRHLRPIAERSIGPTEKALWAKTWRALGQRLEALAAKDASSGHRASANRKYLRAANYYFVGEVVDPCIDQDPAKRELYLDARRVFRAGVALQRLPVEFVEVPFEDGPLEGLFIPVPGATGPTPCMIHFDGADDVKEVSYLRHRHGLAERGISLLIVDHPGSGAAVRLSGLYARPDIEVAASAVADYLEDRGDVDSSRIGILAESFGGYYAPRCAAFEKRLAVCVVWGALWDAHQVFAESPHVDGFDPDRFPLFGIRDSATLEAYSREFSLEGVIDKVTCPMLVIHGENDRVVPLRMAELTYAGAVNAPSRELRIFTARDGGDEHCQLDVWSIATDFIHDWLANFFGTEGDPQKASM